MGSSSDLRYYLASLRILLGSSLTDLVSFSVSIVLGEFSNYCANTSDQVEGPVVVKRLFQLGECEKKIGSDVSVQMRVLFRKFSKFVR